MGQTALVLLAVMTVTLAGDYFLKLAGGHRAGLASGWFALGVVFYLLTAVGWFFLLRSHSLALVAVVYSATTILAMAGLGHFVFGEALSGRQVAGLGLALASVLAMAEV